MKKNIPIYQFIVDDTEESGVKAVSLVADPAFQSKAIFFKKDIMKFIELQESKPKKRRVAGLALIPDVLIFRRDDITGEEYYGFFSKETIEKIVEKFHSELNNNKVNLNHDEKSYIDAVLVEDFIVDTEERVSDLKLKGITHENILGSWYVNYLIKNEETFNNIMQNQKEGNQTGFSVEIFADRYLVELSKQINNNNLKRVMKKNNKSILDKIIQIFKTETLERMLVPELGFVIEWSEVGQPVNRVNVDTEGNETLEPVGQGEFVTDAGVVVVDDASNLVEVRELPEEEVPQPAPVEEAEDELKITDETLGEEEKAQELPEDIPAPVEETPVVDVSSKTIGEIVGTSDGEFWIKVMVENGQITEAEVSSETDLLKQRLSKFESDIKTLEEKNKELEEKMKQPITDPVLDIPAVEKKDWSKMTPYERALYQRKMEK